MNQEALGISHTIPTKTFFVIRFQNLVGFSKDFACIQCLGSVWERFSSRGTVCCVMSRCADCAVQVWSWKLGHRAGSRAMLPMGFEICLIGVSLVYFESCPSSSSSFNLNLELEFPRHHISSGSLRLLKSFIVGMIVVGEEQHILTPSYWIASFMNPDRQEPRN